MIFQFDPNSTKNEGRWRLRSPTDFDNTSFRTVRNTEEGINYIVGILKTGEYAVQAIRFKKAIWSEKKAGKWWKENEKMFTKKWQPKDWLRKKPEKIDRKKALTLCRKLAKIFKLTYVGPKQMGIDGKFKKNIMLPVGSLRQGKDKVGDLDLIVTKAITAEQVQKMDLVELEDISGGEKRIDFKFLYKETFINVNLFVFTEKETWGAALIHSSGPYIYNVRIRNKLKSEKWIEIECMGDGWKLSQKGLFQGDKLYPTPTERSLQKLIRVTERKPDDR